MASGDAKPFPLKNVAYRVTFPILDADGDLVAGAAGLDSEVSKDGGTFADCTNEATQIATSSGIYYLDLTATEMNADTVAIIIKTSTSGAKTTPIVMYPVENTDIPVNVKAISDDTTAPDNLELMYDGTGYAGGTTKLEVNIVKLLGTAWLTPGVAGTPDVNTKLLGGTAQTGNDVGADVNDILTDTGTTLDTLIKDIPTVSEFEARSILAANYVVVGDTIAGVTAVTNDVGITQAGADKVWGTAARALTDKAGFALSAAGITSIWEKNISAFAGAGYAGTYLKVLYDDWLNGGRLDLLIDAILADTAEIGVAGAGLTDLGGMATGMKAEIESECNDALVALKLDHLIAFADGDDPVNDSIIAKMAASDGDWSGFDKAADALEAIRDRGDIGWITGGGGGITDILNVQSLIPLSIDLANTVSARIGLGLTNMLDDLPSTAEITPGTITIDRKAYGGTSWTNIVNAAACSEVAGLIYYDEVFDSGTGYAAGDTIRVTFKSQKITVSANDYEITGTDGWIFYTYIREEMRGTDSAALAANYSATRAGYLDNINNANLATIADISTLTATEIAYLNASISSRSSHAASAIWSVGTRALTDKAGFALSTAGILAIWHQLTANIVTANTIGKLLKDDINATISSRSSHAAADIWSVGTRALTDKAGFSLAAASITAIWEKNISTFSGAGYAGTYVKTLYDDWINAGRLDAMLDIIAADVVNIDGDAMRGTDSANTTTPPTVNAIADQVWDEILTAATHNIATSAGRRLRQAEDVMIVREETCQAGGGSSEIILDSGASAVNEFYINDLVVLTSGTGVGQQRHIDSYVGATKTATVNRAWSTNPDATTTYSIKADSTKHVHGFETAAKAEINAECDTALTDFGKTGFALSAAGVDAILDEVVEGSLTFRQMLRLFTSVLAGKSAGGGTVTLTFRDNADSKDRITATVDASGNRTAMTLDGA